MDNTQKPDSEKRDGGEPVAVAKPDKSALNVLLIILLVMAGIILIGFIVGLIAIIVIAVFVALGPQIKSTFENTSTLNGLPILCLGLTNCGLPSLFGRR